MIDRAARVSTRAALSYPRPRRVVRRTRSAKFTLLSASLWVEIFRTAGVPDGVFNLVNGIGEEAGDALVKHPDVPLISFTGETTTGQTIYRNCAASWPVLAARAPEEALA